MSTLDHSLTRIKSDVTRFRYIRATVLLYLWVVHPKASRPTPCQASEILRYSTCLPCAVGMSLPERGSWSLTMGASASGCAWAPEPGIARMPWWWLRTMSGRDLVLFPIYVAITPRSAHAWACWCRLSYLSIARPSRSHPAKTGLPALPLAANLE